MTAPAHPPPPPHTADQLRALARVNAQSAALHAMRASALQMDVHRRAEQLRQVRASTSWKLTMPLRAPVHVMRAGPALLARTARVVTEALRAGGPALAFARVAARLRRRATAFRKPAVPPRPSGAYDAPLPTPAATVLAPRVLIVAELSLPQCAKYRVWQKQAHFHRIGIPCTVLPWTNIEACRSALQSHSLVIFYRVPGFKDVLGLIDEARRLQAATFWEADDLIFDIVRYRENRNLDTLEPALRKSVLDGVDLFRRAMLACGGTIASTTGLAAAMQAAGAGPSTVIENALDAETLNTADALRARPRPPRDQVVIAYGSGSKAHDIDFAMAAPALARILSERADVTLRIIGDLQLPPALTAHTARIERLPATGYVAYLAVLADADISLAPLEDTAFNDAKSNIKWLEAAVLGLPSVCSPRAAFADAITPGHDGELAETEAEWHAALTRLIDDPALRTRIGAAALATALRRYAPQAIAETQVAPLAAGLDQRHRPAMRVLAVNIFFAPVSFGGATIVAEEMAARLHARPDTAVAVFTSREHPSQYLLRRYDWNGLPVLAASLPGHDVIAEFDNPEMAALFEDVLRATQPDVVHFHSVQMLGATMLRTCQELGIPYVVTVHDAWWVCPRQFMVMENNSYCFQTTIDVTLCEACVPGALHLRERLDILLQGLQAAALVLSPSEAHRKLYLANGLQPGTTLVNRNGIRMPGRPRRRTPGRALRFGFVGGISGLKGFHLVRRAFESLARPDWVLVLVDNTLKLGFSSIDVADWHVQGAIDVVPAFSQDSLDDFFDGIDVLLFPSQWKESFGLIAAEALARDVWVIATEGGGAADFIVGNENGTLIPLRNDHRPLLAAVEALLDAPARLATHANPHKHLLASYEDQANELHAMLASVANPPP